MECREDLKSILPFLPFILRSSSLFWPSKALDSLKALALGPDLSHVNSGEILFDAIIDIRDSLGLSHERLAPNAVDGYSLFFDELMSRADSRFWFSEVVPKLASLLLRLPSLLEAHYRESDVNFGKGKAGLRLMDQQDAGIVFLSQAFTSGSIEGQQHEALEVDFANEYLGGGALHLGCVQEEIRFMINPELIVGMLFMVSMQKNEAIEVIGSERFSNYTGYGSSFRFVGDCVDKKPFDATNRRKTRIIAIDALQCPGKWQYGIDCILREINKAYCGFFDQSKYKSYKKNFQDASPHKKGLSQDEALTIASNDHNDSSDASTQTRDPVASSEGPSASKLSIASETSPEDIGIATGNWGCGAFGGDPEIKCVIQWLAASQALRPFMHYYTFGTTELQKLDEVSHWILSHGWTVGDLWSILIEYSTQRINRETNVGFFSWLLPLNEALHHMSE